MENLVTPLESRKGFFERIKSTAKKKSLVEIIQ